MALSKEDISILAKQDIIILGLHKKIKDKKIKG